MNLVDTCRCKIVREILIRDRLDIRPFVLLAYASIWLEPEWDYQDILSVYAEYVGDAPERVHAELCRRLLMAAKDIGPKAYLAEIRKEVERIENGISAEQGSGACARSPDTREQTGHARSTGHRAAHW